MKSPAKTISRFQIIRCMKIYLSHRKGANDEMKTAKLNEMTKGWFIGNFEPSLFKTNDVEVAVKTYKKGDYEAKHYHKIATEYTCIISGKVKMNGKEYTAGDIIVMHPNDATDFEALEDNTVNVVVKLPGANNDKYVE